MYVNVISAVPLCISTKTCLLPKKVWGTKRRVSAPIQKVEGACPSIHPRIYAHVEENSASNACVLDSPVVFMHPTSVLC